MIPKLLLIPLLAGLIAQLIKVLLETSRGSFRPQAILEYGGMPSGHTALVVSLTTVIGLNQGIDSAAFALSVIFSLIVIRDAVGLRQFIGLHGKTLKMLIEQLPDQEEKKFPQQLAERFGHTPAQAVVGGVIGLALALVLNGWIPG